MLSRFELYPRWVPLLTAHDRRFGAVSGFNNAQTWEVLAPKNLIEAPENNSPTTLDSC